jgi:hypothetical protein
MRPPCDTRRRATMSAWYHAVSFIATAARVKVEADAPTFDAAASYN